MSDIWSDAGAIIDAQFADDDPIIYTGAGLTAEPVEAIWSDVPAVEFEGPGATLRKVTYEIAIGDLPQAPRKTNTFIHRDRSWSPEDITRRDDIGKWQLVVVDTGPAA